MRRACLAYEPFFICRAVSLILAGSPKRKVPVGTITLEHSLSIAPRGSCWMRQSRRWASSGSSVKLRFDDNLVKHLINLKRRYQELEQELTSAELEPRAIAKLGKELSSLGRLMELSNNRLSKLQSISELSAIEREEEAKGPSGEELLLLAREERLTTELELQLIESSIVEILTPKDEADDFGVVIEVRAGTGGDEASLFASEIFKMYQKFAGLQGWRWEEIALSKSEVGGFKEAQALVHGEAVYKQLKFESGVHRVQRIPSNDVRIQTSAISVIIMPEAEDVDVELRPQDLRIDVFRSQGAGGQSVNKTESAVRITHIPTGLSISMQDERSQIQNRARAMKYLKAKLYDLERRKSQQQRQELRSLAQGTGDRTDKIRTYNFPQDRITDHRVSMSISGIERFMNGESLDLMTTALSEFDEKERLNKFLERISSS